MNADDLKAQAAQYSACANALTAQADALEKVAQMRAQASALNQQADQLEQAAAAASGSSCGVLPGGYQAPAMGQPRVPPQAAYGPPQGQPQAMPRPQLAAPIVIDANQ